jgi:general secretion pathway protein E/type IV pilus assembly protein PilB
VLVTGPTGSGKTSTLYSALAELRGHTTKIITIEDPVEYHLDGVCQIQTHTKIGMTFAAGLRSVLRHDPDVILIGEIRDAETAQSAIQAALTGHLVLSTLHTNDAPSAYTRLIDMGVEPYLVASTVQGVLAQRLVRRLCRHCKTAVRDDSSTIPTDCGGAVQDQYRAVGCRECHGVGFTGRAAIFELLQSEEGVRRLCLQRASASAIRSIAHQHGLRSLRDSGWELVQNGETTVDEVLRVVGESID